MIYSRYWYSVCGPKYFVATDQLFSTYAKSELSFLRFCPVASRLSEWIVDDEVLSHSPQSLMMAESLISSR